MSENEHKSLLDLENEEEEEAEEESFFAQLPISNILMNLYDPARTKAFETKVDNYINKQTGPYRLALNVVYVVGGTFMALLYLAFTVMLIPMLGITTTIDMIIMGVIPTEKLKGDK